jgi:flavin-dependent dehydrogenase
VEAGVEAEVDVCVAGGGPAGAAAAIALARGGRRVLLADAPPGGPPLKVGESLPPPVRPLLRDLGVLDRFTGARGLHLPSYGTRALWGGVVTDTDFLFDPNGAGWHVDRRGFDAFLVEEARRAGAVVERARVRGAPTASVAATPPSRTAAPPAPLRRVVLDSGGERAEVACRAVVDATGRAAAVARSLGARRRRHDRLVALYTSVPAGDADGRTIVEACEEGWWYASLVPGGTRILAFLTDADLVAEVGFEAAARRTELIAPLAGEAGAREGARGVGAEGPREGARPRRAAAHTATLSPVAGDGWVAAGDAALALDPLSSQGIFTALFTGIAAAEALDAHLDGDAAAVGRYAQRIDDIATAFLRARGEFYGAEHRWPKAPFWQRRRPQPPAFARASAAATRARSRTARFA